MYVQYHTPQGTLKTINPGDTVSIVVPAYPYTQDFIVGNNEGSPIAALLAVSNRLGMEVFINQPPTPVAPGATSVGTIALKVYGNRGSCTVTVQNTGSNPVFQFTLNLVVQDTPAGTPFPTPSPTSSGGGGIGWVTPPTSPSSPGADGQVAFDGRYFYAYNAATSTWARNGMSSWT